MDVDLVLLGLSGVQRFIAESRTTADVVNASLIIQRLSSTAARTVQRELAELAGPYRLIYPVLESGPDPEGVTSKVAFLARPGTGPGIAQKSMTEVRRAWQDMVTDCFRGTQPPQTPGMPDLWWVSVTGSAATDEVYQQLWRQAGDLAVSRRRSRIFGSVRADETWLCSQSPRLPSVEVPGAARKHERRERLSAAGWVKRTMGRSRGAPAVRSTPSIASTPYRAALLFAAPDGLADLVGSLAEAAAGVTSPIRERPVLNSDVPKALAPLNDQLGAWVHPEVWDLASLRREYRSGVTQDVVDQGRTATSRNSPSGPRSAHPRRTSRS